MIFSLIETAKENGLDPYRYLSWLMSCAAGADLSQPDHVRPLLPWNAPSKCRAGKASPSSRWPEINTPDANICIRGRFF